MLVLIEVPHLETDIRNPLFESNQPQFIIQVYTLELTFVTLNIFIN